MILLVDNYDSFTYNLFQYLRMLGRETQVMRNDAVTIPEIIAAQPELIVLSPGPGGPESTGICGPIIDQLGDSIPILGVCLGMQAIAARYGARVVPAIAPVHGKVRPITHNGEGLFAGLPNPLRVTRYHSLVVEEVSLPDCLTVTARSELGEIMGLAHSSYPVSGVQFHPEALLTEGGLRLLRNALPVPA